jgi:two-component system sensor histidine kinase KdpD
MLPYLGTLLGVAATLGAVGAVEAALERPSATILLYLVPVIFAASRWGRGPAIVAVLASVLGHDVLFVHPRGALTVANADEALGLALLLFTALVTAQLADSARRSSEAIREAALVRRSDELKTALLRAVSHDLRTPLAAIKANVSGLRQADAKYSDDDRAEALAAVEDEADRLDHLVSNLLDFSRIEGGALRPRTRPQDLAELVGAVVARLGARLAGRPISVDVPDDLPSVACDYGQIDQVVSNLLENAALHTPRRTPIRVRARVVGGIAEVEVIDGGPGVPAAERERLFRPFERGRTAGLRGSGLGLAIARGLVEAHGGRLWVDDAPEGGARFAFTLPVARARP